MPDESVMINAVVVTTGDEAVMAAAGRFRPVGLLGQYRMGLEGVRLPDNHVSDVAHAVLIQGHDGAGADGRA